MMLRPRVLVSSLLFAVPVTVLGSILVDRMRTGDMELALDRVVRSQLNDQVRERCESDPKWFLTGPLIGRPPRGEFISANPDALAPRPRVDPQPFELFAYDAQFLGGSSAAPPFPRDFRLALRSSGAAVRAPYVTPEGTGVQQAMPTGWPDSPCLFVLGRMAPPPGQSEQRVKTAAEIYLGALAVALAAGAQTVWRVRRLARDARVAAADGYTTIAPDRMRDELSSVGFVFNNAANELRLRNARIEDQDVALRRLVQTTEDEIAEPLEELTSKLGAIELGEAVADRTHLRGVMSEAHDLTARVENLAATARLRMTGASGAAERVDLNALVARVAARHRPMAHAAGVTINASLPDAAVIIDADESLVERAVANIVDNAIRYNRPGGNVSVTLSRDPVEKRFRLRVVDNGRGVTEEEHRSLTAVRRFRGDEGRNRRPGAPGQGLAVALAAADRCQLTFELKRPGETGLEVEFGGAA